MDRLEEVFQQIADSEQLLGKQQTEIIRIDEILEHLRIEIQSKEIHCKEAQQEIVIQDERLNEALMDEESLKTTLCLKTEQCKELADKNKQLQHLLEEVNVLSEVKRDAFNVQVGQFASDFGFCSDGRMNRESNAHRELEELKKRQLTFEAGLRVGVKNKEQVERLREELKDSQQVSKVKEQELIASKEELSQQMAVSKELILKKSNLCNAPRSDVEFIKLQEELDRERTLGETLETNVKRLQQQLMELQQIHWQQQQQQLLDN